MKKMKVNEMNNDNDNAKMMKIEEWKWNERKKWNEMKW